MKVAKAQTATVLDNKTYSEEYAAKFVTVDGQSFEVRTAKNANDTEYGKTVISNQSGPVFGMAQVYQKSADATPGIQISPRNAGDVAGLTEERFTIESTSGTIAEILEKGEGSYKIENATVVALTQRSFVAKDATGAILVYRGFDAEEKIGEGDVVTIDGLVETYSGMLQFAQSATVTVTSTGSVPAETATEVNASNIQSIIDAEKVVYVKIAGELIKDQTYYNLTFGFETNYGGSIDAPIESLGIDAFVGLPVEVEGWYTGMTKSSTLFTVVATKVAANTSEPFAKFDKESLTFAAEGAEPQTVGITSQNAAGLKFEIEGANKDKFFVKSYTDKTVEVEAKGDNTSDAAYKATLVAKLNDKTLASVALTQSAKATGDEEVVEVVFANELEDGVTNPVIEKGILTITTAKNDGNNPPKYYGNGEALRMYAANTLNVSGATITKIEFVYSGDEYANSFSEISSGDYADSVWTGSADDVTFTVNPEKVNGKNLQARIVSMTITYTK